MNTLTNSLLKRALSILLVTIMVFSLGIVGITSTSAAELELAETGGSNVSGSPTVIFDNTNTGWTGNIYLVYGETSGHVKVVPLGNITNSNLYRSSNLPDYTGNNVDFYAIMSDNDSWDATNNSGYENLKTGDHWTSSYGLEYNMTGGIHLITPDGSTNGTNITIAPQNDYSGLKYNQTANVAKYYSETAYITSNVSSVGTVKITSYYFNDQNNIGGPSDTSTGTSVTYENAARGTSVTMTASEKTGYTFVGWSTKLNESSIVNRDKVFTYYSQTPRTYYALFKEEEPELTISNVTANVGPVGAVNTPVTIEVDYDISDTTVTPDIKLYYDDDTEATGYIVSGKTITFTPTESKTYQMHVKVSYGVVSTTGNVEDFYVKKAFDVKLAPNKTTCNVGDTITFTVTYPSDEADYGAASSYELYNSDNKLISAATWTDNKCTLTIDKVGALSYYAKVNTVSCGSKTSNTVNLIVSDPASETSNVVIYFKAPVAWGYQPNISVNDREKQPMTKLEAAMITKNDSMTATYYWYSYDLGPVNGGDVNEIRITANRDYFYKGYYKLVVMDETDYEVDGNNKCFYFALDNLNDRSEGKGMTNLSTWEVDVRNATESAVNMIITASEAQAYAAVGYSFSGADFGDANCDGKLNVRDATYIQKSLANMVEADELSEIVSDYNQDGKVTIKDATAIQKAVAGL